jgi:phage tail protein X
MDTIYRTQDSDMLDDICFRQYGRQSGAVEAVLEANPGLAEQGPVYSSGLLITLPVITPAPAVASPVRLWD